MSAGEKDIISFEKLRELDAQLEAQLKSFTTRETVQKNTGSERNSFSLIRCLSRIFLVGFFLLLPFFLLIRISLYTYLNYGIGGWWALAVGIAVTVFLLILYGLYLTFRVSGKIKASRFLIRASTVLVIAYCGYGLLYLSSAHVKNEQERSHYRSLHPILRVTISTATLADSDLLITDMHRSPKDYRQMELSVKQQSLHYKQFTGYVHAVDLRTIGRAEWKNWLTAHIFNLLGFHTLRHVGTADHLHVALPLNDW